MCKLVVVALLGMLALAAAVDVEPQKKYPHSHKKESYEKDDGYGEHHDVPKNWVEAKSRTWTWEETLIKTFPCAPEYEIYGSNVAYTAELKEGGKSIGYVFWSGIVVKYDECAHCKDYKSTGFHSVRVNYQITFDVEGKGQIVAEGVAFSVFSSDPVTLAVVGGTGIYTGLTGTFTWTGLTTPSTYEFDVFFPKVHHSEGHHGGKDYDSDKDYKDYKY